ncbi:helix-turn-helix domain-containing protein [Tsukamurella sp. 8F]|uniref:PucR family transcriptional regulator n=1 Tax=unclassified Tsukamurella TaxID=2633480 RepID=UPI0023B96437|nr:MULTISPECIES: PucR family transcriptional regulator [unclassified Tsukamurella]MDF0531468.1 helix-turn-helix domain-containing protein [Tsukamurella sp. 8J]MDF0587469.1 helix-turn-helix domain-containing protein [Tsukamurella sp. 8F]
MDPATAWLAEFYRDVDADGGPDALAHRIDAGIITDFPEFGADESLRRDLHACTRGHWRDFLVHLGRESFEPGVPVEALDLMRTVIRRGHDVGFLLAAYRTGQRCVWDYFTALLDERIPAADLRAAVLIQFWERASQWLDHTVAHVIDTFDAERVAIDLATAQRRMRTVRALLDGDALDADAAAHDLGYRLRGTHTAYVVSIADGAGDDDAGTILTRAGAAVADATRADGRLAVRAGTRALWLWIATGAPLAPADVPPGVRVAAGRPGVGPEGFVRSHREAVAAQSLDAHAARPAGAGTSPLETPRAMRSYADVEIACIATGLIGRSAVPGLVRRELGMLAADDESSLRIRETVLCYLAHGASARDTAEAMTVHPNTVRYRLRQAEEVLGHPIASRRIYTELALRVLDAFGTVAAIPVG